MAVSWVRTGPNATLTVTLNVADLIANNTATLQDKINTGLQRCADQISQTIQSNNAATGIDKQISDLQAAKAALPAPITSL